MLCIAHTVQCKSTYTLLLVLSLLLLYSFILKDHISQLPGSFQYSTPDEGCYHTPAFTDSFKEHCPFFDKYTSMQPYLDAAQSYWPICFHKSLTNYIEYRRLITLLNLQPVDHSLLRYTAMFNEYKYMKVKRHLESSWTLLALSQRKFYRLRLHYRLNEGSLVHIPK